MPCAIDIATSPPWAIRTLSKRTWLLLVVIFSVFGCAAWVIAGRPRRMPLLPRGAATGSGISPAEALRRHPAGRAMGLDFDEAPPDRGLRQAQPLGPDDDPAFLMELERRIRDSRDDY